MVAPRHFNDGLLSALTGAAVGSAFGQLGGFCPFPVFMSDQAIEWTFQSSWLMRKIITKPATEMTREGRDWQADKDIIAKLEAEEKRLGLKAKLRQAEVLRGKGGGGMVLYVKGDTQTNPLDPNTIRAKGLTRIHVWHKSRFTLGQPIEDWDDDWFGHPSYYEVQLQTVIGRMGQKFHPSRVVAFRGAEVDDVAGFSPRTYSWWWGQSQVEIVRDAVENVHTGQNAFAKLIRRTAIRRLSVPKLFEKVATADKEAMFTKRVAAIAAGESSDDITWLDGGDGDGKGAETMTDHEVSWQGVPDVMASYLATAAAAASIPATVLLEKSPDGMNATGDGDNRNWEKEVKSRQDDNLRPCLDQIDRALIPSALGKPDDTVWWEFAPLSVPTEKEKNDTFKVFVDAVDKLDQTSLVPKIAMEKAVQNEITERGYLAGFDDALGDIPEDERFPSLSGDGEDDDDPSAVKGGGPDLAGGGGGSPRPSARRAVTDASFSDATPRTLYVRRDVMPETVRALKAWAREQGLPELQDGLHVTICHIDQPFDWMKVEGDWNQRDDGEITIPPGGVRIVEPLGNRSAVLLFTSSQLSWRHESILRSAETQDKFPSYQPHVSLTGEPVDLSGVEPFRGKIVLGPEIFEQVRMDVYGGDNEG